MGSHYIPVSGITIDTIKDAIADALPDVINLDILCPAAGYDTTPPDPAVFCPANGYTKPEEVWEPPVEIIPPSEQQIVLMCDDTGYGVVAFYCKELTNKQIKFECLDSNYNQLFTSNINSGNYTYIFPSSGMGTIYLIRLSALNSGDQIVIFHLITITGYPNRDYSVYKAIFNCPYLTTSVSGFQDNSHIKEIEFIGSCDSLTDLSNFVNNSGIEKIIWPSSMTSLQKMVGMIRNTKKLKSIDFSSYVLDNVTDVSHFAYGSDVEIIKFPAVMNSVVNATNICLQTLKLKQIVMFSSTAVINMSYAFRYSGIPELTIPAMPGCNTIAYIACDMPNCKKIELQGNWSGATVNTNAFTYNPMLEELIFPEVVHSTFSMSICLGSTKIRKLGWPINLPEVINISTNSGLTNILEELTRVHTKATAITIFAILSHKLKSFNQPNLTCDKLTVGMSATMIAPCTSVEVDWANSPWGNSSAIVLYANLDSAELNRIYTALPTVSAKSIDARYCPGFAGSDHSIAQAKGWTVLGA